MAVDADVGVVYVTLQEAREDADCCDVVGESVLTSEIDAWNVSYLADQVFGTPGVGEAQEKRARALCKFDKKGDVFSNVFCACSLFLSSVRPSVRAPSLSFLLCALPVFVISFFSLHVHRNTPTHSNICHT